MEYKATKDIARKVLKTVDAGLVSGLGEQKPGKMCIEAAVCYAFGLPHGDRPPCVGDTVRAFKIALNDSYWPSVKDRTEGMRKLSIAQLGSNEIDQDEFSEKVGFRAMTTVLPSILENALKEDSGKTLTPKDKDLEEVIKELKSAKDFNSAKIAVKKAREIYSAYAYASSSAHASAYAKKNKTFSLNVLNLIAKCGLDTLIEMKSPGTKWLDLCK